MTLMLRCACNKSLTPGRSMLDLYCCPCAEEPARNPGDMDYWITDRIPLNVAAPRSGNTGSMDYWITERIPLNVWAGRP